MVFGACWSFSPILCPEFAQVLIDLACTLLLLISEITNCARWLVHEMAEFIST